MSNNHLLYGPDGHLIWAESGTGEGHLINGAYPYFSTASLPVAYQGFAYSATILVTGPSTPISVALVSGTLPTGLSFSNGIISGTPSGLIGGFQLVFQATGADGLKITQGYTLLTQYPPLKFQLEYWNDPWTEFDLAVVEPQKSREAPYGNYAYCNSSYPFPGYSFGDPYFGQYSRWGCDFDCCYYDGDYSPSGGVLNGTAYQAWNAPEGNYTSFSSGTPCTVSWPNLGAVAPAGTYKISIYYAGNGGYSDYYVGATLTVLLGGVVVETLVNDIEFAVGYYLPESGPVFTYDYNP